MTYQELDRLTDDLARRLVEAGARPDQPIGVLLPRSAEQVVALLAAIKSGGAPMPLDVNAPEPRVLGMLERARWPVLVAGRNAKPTLASYPGPILSAFTDEAPMALAETSTPAPSQLAYVIHTSGSTGTPKAVMVEHAALANRLEWAKKAYPLHPGDKLLYGANPAFDFALWEVFGCLISGACLVIPDAVVASDPGRLVSFMRDIGVSVAHFTPALLQLVAEESEFPRCDDLRLILSGGDVLPKETEQLVLDRSKAALYNQYGPTEGAIDVLSWRCRRDEGRWKPPLGRPIDGVATYLLDEEFEPVAIGLAGEIWVGGAAVARGYLSAPRETASRFRPDPYGGPGSRLYRTGDLARRRWDGALEFIGRRDSQVNVRGYRVELGEIEAAVRGHPEVDDCIASCVGDGFAGRLVLHWKGRASADSLRRWAGARLPDYMTPTSYVQVANFPLTPTGKIDRGALPSASRRLAFEAPATAVEAMLADLWCATFADHGVEIDALSVHDDFFELGGHSLLAIRLVNRIRSLTGLPVRIGAFFEALTVRDVAAVLVAEDPEGRLERAAEYWRDLPLPIGGDLEAGPGNTAKNGWTS